MKKIIALTMALLISLSLISCGGDSEHEHEHEHEDSETYINYFEGGIYFSLPGDYVTKKYPYGDYVYVCDNSTTTETEKAYFILNIYDEVELEEDMRLPKTISVREYAQIIVTDMMCDDYKYDAATDSATFDYVYKYTDDSGMPNEYYLYKILRNEDSLYQIVLSCDEEDISKYKDTFNAILKTVTLG
ncbi:MAG: hypothetical protein IKV16_05780 [Clostridia bacterium]|nr:hypothetical protein [Clostridia bacterium]